MTSPVSPAAIPALLVALGLTAGGFLAGSGFARVRMAERFVSVKGVAEREVKADLALWPMRLVVGDNDLARAQTRLASNVALIRAFLVRHHVDTASAMLGEFEVADAYVSGRTRSEIGDRYVVRQTLIVRSDKPDLVFAASQRVGELVSAGVVLSSGDYGAGGPSFVFTRLNDIKPAMIAEATEHAREAAEQFARDSKSALGAIRQANQGTFVILGRDDAGGIREESQVAKRVRVVTSVDWFLRD